MEKMNYTELDWRWALVLGVALRDGLLDEVAREPRSADDVARRLDFDPRATYVLLSALGELGILEEVVAIREFVHGMSDDAALFAVNMLVLTAGGGTYTADEYEGWLAGAGFDAVEFVPVPGRGTHLIFARNPG